MLEGVKQAKLLEGRILAFYQLVEEKKFFATKYDRYMDAIASLTGEFRQLIRLAQTYLYDKWRYEMPESVEDRKMLKKIARLTLLYENYFVDLYRKTINSNVDFAEQMEGAVTLFGSKAV